MCVLASAFTACVNEIPVDGPDSGRPGELSIVFAVGDAQTRATSASEGNYVYATDKEVQINNFHVALFDATSNAVIKSEDVTAPASNLESEADWVDNKKTYKVSFTDISVKDHPSVYAVVIANYNDKVDLNDRAFDFSACANFDAYKKVVKETAAFSDTTTLMKVGKSANTSISLGIANKVIVPLTQLTARIDFKGVIVGEEPTKALSTKAGEVTSTSTPIYGYLGKGAVTDNNILTALQDQIKSVASDVTWEPHVEGRENNPYKTEQWGWKDLGRKYYYQKWENSPLWYGYFAKKRNEDDKNCYKRDGVLDRNEYYEVPTHYKNRAILVGKTYTETRTASTTKSSLPTKAGGSAKQFIVENVVYSGFNTQSDLAIFDNTKVENSVCVPYAGTDKKHEGNTPFSFYTYERPKSSSSPVTLSITGYFAEDGGSVDPEPDPDPDPVEPTTETYSVTEYGYIIQSRGNGWPEEEPTSDELAALENDFVMVTKVEEKIETKSSTKGMATKAKSPSRTYTLELGQYDFIKGNCYSLTGYVKQTGLEWVIEKLPWEEKPVDVHFGGNWGN